MQSASYCELYLVKALGSDERCLVYGYAQNYLGTFRGWSLETAKKTTPNLEILRATLSKAELDALVASLAADNSFPIVIDPSASESIQIRGAARVARPKILRHPRMDRRAFDASYTNQLCEVQEYWSFDKAAVLSILSGDSGIASERDARVDGIIRFVAASVGKDFETRAYSALGNFELFNVRAHVYRWRPTSKGVIIEIDETSLGIGDTVYVSVALQNARVTTHASLREWHRGDPPGLEFASEEPLSWAEVMIFERSGALIDHGLHGLITSITLSGNLVSQQKTISDAWSRQLEQKVGKRNAAQLSYINKVSVVGPVLDANVWGPDPTEPWQPYCGGPSLLVTATDNTLFLPKQSAAEELARFAAIRDLFDAKDVTRVTCVDPYFDKKALGLLARMRHRCRVEILTRVKEDVLQEMVETLRHKSMFITPAVSLKRAKHEFHDRFLVVERGTARSSFVVSNSFSPLGSTDPIILVRATGPHELRIWEYIEALRADAVAHWPQPRASSLASPGAHLGGAIIAGILGSPTANAKELVSKVRNEIWPQMGSYLASHPDPSVVERILDFLGGHSNPSEDFQAMPVALRAAACESLRQTLEKMILDLTVPQVPRHISHTPIEVWIELLRAISIAMPATSPLAAAMVEARSRRVRYEVHYALNFGMRAFAAWDTQAFAALVSGHLEKAVAGLASLSDDEDAALSRPIVTGAVLLKELFAVGLDATIADTFVSVDTKAMRRLGVVALFSAREQTSPHVAKMALSHGADVEDVVWALLATPITERGNSWIAEIADSVVQTDLARFDVLVAATKPDVILEVADELTRRGEARASRLYAFVHERFEAELAEAKLEHLHVAKVDLRKLVSAARALAERHRLEPFDLTKHLDQVIRKWARRSMGLFLPRMPALKYDAWIGSVRLAQLASLYLTEVSKLSPVNLQDSNIARLTSLLCDLLEWGKPQRALLDEASDEEPSDDGLPQLHDALERIRALRDTVLATNKGNVAPGRDAISSDQTGGQQ